MAAEISMGHNPCMFKAMWIVGLSSDSGYVVCGDYCDDWTVIGGGATGL